MYFYFCLNKNNNNLDFSVERITTSNFDVMNYNKKISKCEINLAKFVCKVAKFGIFVMLGIRNEVKHNFGLVFLPEFPRPSPCLSALSWTRVGLAAN